MARPKGSADLLEDRRFVTVRRHLRAMYPNPFTGKPDWEPIRAGKGRIVGVRAVWPAEGTKASKEFVFVR